MANGQISSEDIEVLISYSHNDELLRNELEKHLSILKRQKLISTWYDRKIGAGEEWKGQIDDHLNSAQIILLLISAVLSKFLLIFYYSYYPNTHIFNPKLLSI
jgi:hypothetical protein